MTDLKTPQTNTNHPLPPPSAKPRIGIALGSGAARGWAHLGVLRALAELGIEPDIVAGCSIGAVVGAAHAAHNIDRLEKGILSLSKLDMMRFFELKLSLNGVVRKDKLHQFLHQYVCAELQTIAGLRRPFATVATCLGSGREVWLTEGKVMDAMMASIALPGLFPAFPHQDRWLVDGGLVNPVPVSLCRALGAEVVIAVNLNSLLARPHFQGTTPPSLIDTVTGSVNIMQDKITRSRMAGDPPEVLLTPKLTDIGLLEFYRAQESITAGYECVQRLRHELEFLLD